MGGDCLLVISHPDDDAIFAGALQAYLSAARWSVVCATYTADDPRGRELLAWQRALGTDPERIHFLGFADDREDRERQCCSFEGGLTDALAQLRLRPSLVVTHNARGEYDHPHHVAVHGAAMKSYPDTACLAFGFGVCDADLTLPSPGKRAEVTRYYPSQAASIRRTARSTERFLWLRRPRPPIRADDAPLFEQLRALEVDASSDKHVRSRA
jgi:LmbE family N-acetylglucosaminyl deacetylase